MIGLGRREAQAVMAARLRRLSRAFEEHRADATTAVRSPHEELEQLAASTGDRRPATGDRGESLAMLGVVAR